MKANNIMKTLLVAGIALVGLNSCQEKLHFFAKGDEVKFTVGSSQEVETKAAYQAFTGSEAVGGKVRIDWQEGDLVRIYCAQSEEPEEKYADYVVNKVLGNEGAVSKARIGHIELGQMGLRWGKDETHYFYAAFPSPGVNGITQSISANTVSANLPAEQNTLEDALSGSNGNYTLAPDLKWQLMTASASYSPATGIPGDDGVFLSFTPRSTAINFTIENGVSTPLNIDKIELISDATQISGGYSLDIDEGKVTGKGVTDDTRSVYVTIPEDEVSLAEGKTFNFTLFLAPTQDINDLTFKIYKHSDNGGTPEYIWMSTKLAYNDGERTGVVFPKSKITFVKGLIVPEGAQWQVKYSPDVDVWSEEEEGSTAPGPGIEFTPFVTNWEVGTSKSISLYKYIYTLDYEGNTVLTHEGTGTGHATISVSSKRNKDDGTPQGVLWHVEYYDEVSNNWVVPDLDDDWTNSNGETEAEDDKGSVWINDFVRIKPIKGQSKVPMDVIFEVKGVTSSETRSESHNDRIRTGTRGSESNPYDLSVHDIYGNERENGPITANSYVVSHPGWYAFPLVYGNGVDWNNAPNDGDYSNAYNPGGEGADIDSFLSRFINSEGKGIRSPYIETDLKNTVTIDNNWTANVSWSDKDGLISTTSVSVVPRGSLGLTSCDCGYVVFNVPVTVTQGNAVITVSVGSKIVWSWHIWFTDNDLTTVEYGTDDRVQRINMMPVNLGWVDNDTETQKFHYLGKSIRMRLVQHQSEICKEFTIVRKDENGLTTASDGYSPYYDGYSPYYQFGRKDPFLDGKYVKTGYSELCTLDYTIQHPNEFIYNESGWWYYFAITEGVSTSAAHFYNLWNSKLRSVPLKQNAPSKTIFDPCPPGFQVPQGNAFIKCSDSTKGTWKNGYYFTARDGESKVFFPAEGMLQRSTGNPYRSGSEGDYWTSSPNDVNKSIGFYFDSTSINPTNYVEWCAGLSVRPVAE